MALPTSRNTTYAPLSQVKSVDLNAIQDVLIDHETRVDDAEADIVDHETRITSLETDRVVIHANAGNEAGSTDWTRFSLSVEATVASPGAWEIPIPVKEGWLLTVDVHIKHSVAGAGNIVPTLWRTPSAAGLTSVAAGVSTATAAEQDVQVVADHPVVSGNAYWVGFTGAGGAMTRNVYRITVTHTRP